MDSLGPMQNYMLWFQGSLDKGSYLAPHIAHYSALLSGISEDDPDLLAIEETRGKLVFQGNRFEKLISESWKSLEGAVFEKSEPEIDPKDSQNNQEPSSENNLLILFDKGRDGIE